MNWKNRLQNWIRLRRQEMQKGLELTLQKKDEQERKKIHDARYMDPGTFKYGILNRQNPLDFMHDVYDRRKQKRKDKD
jgi:hypothetical protein